MNQICGQNSVNEDVWLYIVSLASPVFLEPRVISHKHCYCPFIVCNHAKTAFCVTCRWNILAGYVSFKRTLKPPSSDCFIHTGRYAVH